MKPFADPHGSKVAPSLPPFIVGRFGEDSPKNRSHTSIHFDGLTIARMDMKGRG